jgi:hypothetical protein
MTTVALENYNDYKVVITIVSDMCTSDDAQSLLRGTPRMVD